MSGTVSYDELQVLEKSSWASVRDLWSWAARPSTAFRSKILVRSPLPGLLAAGAYAATELFLGGGPTALYTGSLAADLILDAGPP
jgi:hypothetical protein